MMFAIAPENTKLPSLFFLILAALAPIGCFMPGLEQVDTIFKSPPDSWSYQNCMSVVAWSTRHNLYDKSNNISILATPFTPSVINAIGRMNLLNKRESNNELDEYVASLLSEHLGHSVASISIDSANLVQKLDLGDMDSVSFAISLQNRTYPCSVPVVNVPIGNHTFIMKPIAAQADLPCLTPDISRLEDELFLENDRRELLKPLFIWGRRHTSLTTDELIIVKFQLGYQGYHFLRDCKTMSLYFAKVENGFRLEFPVKLY